ncbi:MAG: hypothetical protein L3K06_01365 [Thermoplasmata archaeon]|nr:hypothetical protein [Thermoplasmata archaeon]
MVLVALAGLELLPIYLASHPAPTAPGPGHGTLADLCTPTTGTDCRGNTFVLPETVNGNLVNATGCDAFASWGASEILWLNYTVDAPIYSVVLPSVVFGASLGWTVDAFELVANQTALRSALWLSPLASGTFSEAIHVPNGGGTYCIGWWAPLAQATVQWQGDVTVTYFSA